MSTRCDFHVHSTFSDGTLTPVELSERASERDVSTFALTDHDEVGGFAGAARRGRELGIEVIAGIELSVSEEEGRREMHVLGLGIDPEHAELRGCTAELREQRSCRGLAILERLRQLGIELSPARLREIAGEGTLGRPHVARALIEAGVCADPDEAFARFLRRGRPAYVAHVGLAARAAISLIHAAGGIACLAHPLLSVGVDKAGGLEGFVERLVGFGLDGLEVWHPSQNPGQTRRIKRIARRFGLVESGGSDFHGESRPDVELGRGRGGLRVGRIERERILERIAQVRVSGSV